MLKIIKASAGSGKTFQLTREYIKLLLGHKNADGSYTLPETGRRNYHAHILAVTFTKKATQEMKDRILKELKLLAGMESGERSAHADGLCAELNTTPEKLKKAAEKALVEILYDYTNFNVNTIDSFFQQILRTFAREVDIPYNYDVELNDKYVVKVGVKSFLSDVVADRNVSRHVKQWIKDYILNEIEEDRDWNIFKSVENDNTGSLCDFASVLNQEDFKQLHVELENYLDDYDTTDETGQFKNISAFKGKIYQAVSDIQRQGVKILEMVIGLFQNAGIEWSDFSKNGGMQWLINIVQNECPADGLNLTNSDLLDKIKNSEAKSDKWLLKKFNGKLTDELAGQINGLLEKLVGCAHSYNQFKGIHKNIYTLGLLGQISKKITQYRNENNLILLSDTNEILGRIINESDVPFIYDRVGVWLNHYLIDEFQDTSQMQWNNLKPLLHQSESSGNDNLIIGDEKQSIYRFRNSDFTLLQTGVQQEFHMEKSPTHYSTNWRSAPNIIKFNNTFFSIIAQRLCANDVYETLLQLPSGKKSLPDGYVRISYLPKSLKRVNQETEAEETLNFKEQVLEELPVLINSILARGYEQQDIAVLVNRNTEGAMVIDALLQYNMSADGKEHPINVISSDSLLLNNSSSVKLIINSLRFIDSKNTDNAGDQEKNSHKSRRELDEHLHWVLKEYERHINEGMEPGQALLESFEKADERQDYQESIGRILPRNAESMSLVAVTERIINETLSDEAKVKENAFIHAFQDEVIKYSKRTTATLRGFLRWWDNGGNSMSINSPEGENAVNVLTIHKSKGLEYKCVILPFCDWNIGAYPKNARFWVKKSDITAAEGSFWETNNNVIPPIFPVTDSKLTALEDSPFAKAYNVEVKKRVIDDLNKTYVAFTRAENELYIFAPLNSDKKGNSASNNAINGLLCDFVDAATAEKAAALRELVGTGQEMGVELSIDNDVLTLGQEPLITAGKTVEDTGKEDMPPYKVVNIPDRVKFVIPDVFEPQQRKQGIKLHKILSKIRTLNDVDFALAWAKGRHILLEKEYESYQPKIVKAFENATVQDWFNVGNKVYNERSLLCRDAKFRPDRFIVTPDGRAIVIDFKFGEEHSKSYHKQVANYMRILSQITSAQVEGYIWYPLEDVIETVKSR